MDHRNIFDSKEPIYSYLTDAEADALLGHASDFLGRPLFEHEARGVLTVADNIRRNADWLEDVLANGGALLPRKAPLEPEDSPMFVLSDEVADLGGLVKAEHNEAWLAHA